MSKRIHKLYLMFVMLFTLVLSMSPVVAFANGTNDDSTNNTNSLRYYLGSAVNTGKDNGYSKTDNIGVKDPHYGWDLGMFFVNGYSRVSKDADGNLIFLKNVGDLVTLWFSLGQDIDCLNGNSNLTINEDSNGYDEYFGINRTNFGRGTLIVRYTDYKNLTGDPVIYSDYLSARVTTGADTKVELFEEGDYEISLDYEIKDSPRKIFGIDIVPNYTNYKILFRFSVRNGNCMVYPFDITTKAELTNSAITENGFYLDLAKSRYLDINIKKEVLKDGANGLTEDVRFNRPAKDGDQYTDEGIYTFSVRNRYTGQETTKKIYVGTNNVLKAYFTTGLSIGEIEYQLAQGATITGDGRIIQPVVKPTVELPGQNSEVLSLEKPAVSTVILPQDSIVILCGIGGGVVLLLVALVLVIRKISSNKARNAYGEVNKGNNLNSGREDNSK